MTRTVLLVAHTQRRQICSAASRAAQQLLEAGLAVRMLQQDAVHVDVDGLTVISADSGADLDGGSLGSAAGVAADTDPDGAAAGADTDPAGAAAGAAAGAEVALALGGDGTFLRAAELARPAGVPMLGVNLGHVGFLAEAEPNALDETVAAIVRGEYEVEQRVTVEAEVIVDGAVQSRAWALNEVSLDRSNRERMLEIAVAVDSRPLLRFGCDGILCATPTGSTAYAFSAGGPIMWPDVDAMLVVPNAAHALFSRPIVVAPSSIVDIDLLSHGHEGSLSSDGRRSVPVPPGSRVRVRRGSLPVHIARVAAGWSFTDRLVAKFQLPVRSLREAAPPLGLPDSDE